MPAVSNTSPLLNLAIIGRLALLKEQFETIFIPPAVREELRIESDLPGSKVIGEAIEAGWIQIEQVRDMAFVKILRRELDKGESEAIALALQAQADWTLLDEKEGRRVAKSLGLRVTGVLGILLCARREGKLEHFEKVLEDLRGKAGFHIRDDLLKDVLKEESNNY
jgi:predicted nucleic acid-binding protein